MHSMFTSSKYSIVCLLGNTFFPCVSARIIGIERHFTSLEGISISIMVELACSERVIESLLHFICLTLSLSCATLWLTHTFN